MTVLLLVSSCDFTMPRIAQHDSIDSIMIRRYDRVESRYLTTGDFAALQEMNTVYPTETRALIEDLLKLGSVSEVDINKKLLDFYQDSTLQNVIYAAETEYADMSDLNDQLKKAFAKLRKEIPEIEIPTFYAQIGAFDQSIVVDDKAIGISLDKYLGKDFPIYKRFYEKEQLESMSREYIVPDCIVFYLISMFPMANFDERTQYERDIHFAKLSWATNYVTETELLKNDYTQKVNLFMREHKDVSLKDLLTMENNIEFDM